MGNVKSEVELDQSSNPPKWEIKVRLIVSGFKDPPQSITARLGCQPSETWLTGDRVLPQAANVHHENGWVLRSPVDPFQTTLDQAVEALFTIIPNPAAFKSLPPEIDIEIGCAVFVHSEEWPYLGLSSKLVSRMAAIGASFDLDLYPPA